MKIKTVPAIIAVALCALIAYGFYAGSRSEDQRLWVTIGGGLSLLLTVGAVLGVSLERTRASVNMKIVSGIFAGILLLLNIIFCCFSSFSLPVYIILSGILLLTWLLVVYGIARAKMD